MSLFFKSVLAILLAFPAVADEAAWEALEQPGAFVLMRHALAPGTGDPAEVRIGDCSTQRNLNETGREQARRIGRAFRKRGIAFDAVFTSQWCRCRETAELLGLGLASDLPSLNSFYKNWQASVSQTATTKKFLSENLPRKRLLLVTHQVNIRALTNAHTRSGEALVVRRFPDGMLRPIGSIHIPHE